MLFNKEICEKKISKNEAIKTKNLSYFRSIYFYFFLFLFVIDFTEARGNNKCLPLINKTCRFGGECTSVTTLLLELGVEFELSDYVCHCRIFDCRSYGFDPVCGSDGRTHHNDVCRRQAECISQKRIDRVCMGSCSIPKTCKAIKNEPKRCPDELSNYCSNFGECVLSEEKKPYCKCLIGYTGMRCEYRDYRSNPIVSVLERIVGKR